jgi:hypothetical protein
LNVGQSIRSDVISRRYGTVAAGEYQRLLYHFDFAQDFELLVLVVPDADGANSRRRELARILSDDGERLLEINAVTPESFPVAAVGVEANHRPLDRRRLAGRRRATLGAEFSRTGRRRGGGRSKA